MNSQEDILIPRLNAIDSWVKNNNFVLIKGGGSGYSFSLRGKNGNRLFTFYHKGRFKGEMYAYIADNKFPGSAIERDAFVDELKIINLFDKNFDSSTKDSHKHFRRKLQHLTDDQFEELLTILGKYCSP
ncbi:MAG: hypothetical protein ACYC6G_11400 [Desulfobaccales bacterium]